MTEEESTHADIYAPGVVVAHDTQLRTELRRERQTAHETVVGGATLTGIAVTSSGS